MKSISGLYLLIFSLIPSLISLTFCFDLHFLVVSVKVVLMLDDIERRTTLISFVNMYLSNDHLSFSLSSSAQSNKKKKKMKSLIANVSLPMLCCSCFSLSILVTHNMESKNHKWPLILLFPLSKNVNWLNIFTDFSPQIVFFSWVISFTAVILNAEFTDVTITCFVICCHWSMLI